MPYVFVQIVVLSNGAVMVIGLLLFADGSSKTVFTLLHSWEAESISMGKKEELWNAKPIKLPNHAIIKQISL